MLARSHLVVAACAYAGAVQSGLLQGGTGAIVACLLGGLAPDIDHPSSRFGRWLPLTSGVVTGITGHRGATHSLVAVAAVLGFGYWLTTQSTLPLPWVLGFTVGWASHLLADGLTYGGVPWLWPLRRRYGLGLMRTGGAGEAVFTTLALMGFGAWAWGRFAPWLSSGLPPGLRHLLA
ncbi:MAG: metal-dependent hydrolase [Geminicoccaceae bacterium]|nr:metal-dependent hydrolase [Geminicoccaceae bacterium]